jgi:hypothetical protein
MVHFDNTQHSTLMSQVKETNRFRFLLVVDHGYLLPADTGHRQADRSSLDLLEASK